jgi:leucyl-tRNA synthetase
VLHLLYSRFFNRVLSELGLVSVREPFENLLTQGMVIKDGSKMSKSKGNVVDPDYLVERFGADTVRLFCLFASPPEKDLDWSDKGVEGAYRFLQRLWRLVMERQAELKGAVPVYSSVSGDKECSALLHMVHKTTKKVTEDVERFHLNTGIAAAMELVNAIYKFVESGRMEGEAASVVRAAIDRLIVLVSPFCPHLAQELWSELGQAGLLVDYPWPSYDEAYITEETVTVAVQVNGKLRDTVDVERDMDEAALKGLILSLEKVRRHLTEKPIRKVIVVPNKLVNIVS